MTEPDIVTPVALQHTQQVTCTSPWYVQNTEYPPAMATYQPLINGEEAFRAVHLAIAKATKTVDIICWGFQPSMFFIRDGRAPSIGELLMIKAREGVEVRVLGWDPQLSPYTLGAMAIAATHHQKTVLVDYEQTDSAVGFVMGHNMLDEYWDTDKHTALNRSEGSKPAPNCGPRGDTPRQDISSQVSGPILEHLHHNFATAWRKETGEDLLASRQAMQVGPQLQCTPGTTRQIAQIVRTQPQDKNKRDIEKLYLKAVNNATQFIYIENQYFRWPPLAEAINKAAADQTRAGRDPGLHGNLHLFVITNVSPDGVGPGAVNTQRMLESLGRGETIPAITKLQRIEQAKAQTDAMAPTLAELLEQQALLTLTRLTDAMGGGEMSDKAREAQRDAARNNEFRQIWLKEQIEAIEKSTLVPTPRPGLKIHVCSLVAPDSPAGKPWMPVYIHSKLMIVNDVFTTHGSANINTRSMQADSELNIAHEWMSVTQAMRRRLWNLHTKEKGAQDDPEEAFKAWEDIIDKNKKRQKSRKVPYAPLVEFYYGEASLTDLD